MFTACSTIFPFAPVFVHPSTPSNYVVFFTEYCVYSYIFLYFPTTFFSPGMRLKKKKKDEENTVEKVLVVGMKSKIDKYEFC